MKCLGILVSTNGMNNCCERLAHQQKSKESTKGVIPRYLLANGCSSAALGLLVSFWQSPVARADAFAGSVIDFPAHSVPGSVAQRRSERKLLHTKERLELRKEFWEFPSKTQGSGFGYFSLVFSPFVGRQRARAARSRARTSHPAHSSETAPLPRVTFGEIGTGSVNRDHPPEPTRSSVPNDLAYVGYSASCEVFNWTQRGKYPPQNAL